MTITKKQCSDWGNAIKLKADEFYAARLAATNELIAADNAAGRDPSKHQYEGGIATIDLNELLARTLGAKDLAYASADTQASKCDLEAVPEFLGDAQKVSDYATVLATLPYALLNKEYAEKAHIDLGEVYKGKPLGGDNALVPKAREDALNALGIGGDAAQAIRDPGKPLREAAEAAANAQRAAEDAAKQAAAQAAAAAATAAEAAKAAAAAAAKAAEDAAKAAQDAQRARQCHWRNKALVANIRRKK